MKFHFGGEGGGVGVDGFGCGVVVVGGYVGDALIVWECVGDALAMFWGMCWLWFGNVLVMFL